MLTGVETAGIVLAVLPLLISALEHYNEGLEPIKAFWEFDYQLPLHIRKLRNQHVHYEQTLRLLLSPIAEAHKVGEMIEAPNGNLWRDPQMQEKLEDRLQESYEAYHETVVHMEELMKRLARDLKIDGNERANRANLQALLKSTPRKDNKFEFLRRVKFGMSKKKLKVLLDDFDECNKELERFTDKSERLEPYRANSRSAFEPPLSQIRSYANSLYNILCVGVSCKTSHQARLQLERRISPWKSSSKFRQGKQAGGQSNREPCFTVSFDVADPSCAQAGLLWTWQDAQVRILEPNAASAYKAVQLINVPPTPTIACVANAGDSGVGLSESTSILRPSGASALNRDAPSGSSNCQGQIPRHAGETPASRGEFLPQKINHIHSSPPGPTTHLKPTRKTVEWVSPPSINVHNAAWPASANMVIAESLQEIVDICTAIKQRKWSQSCLGFCLDCYGKLRGVYSVTDSEVSKHKKTTTLEELLEAHPETTSGRNISRRDRMALAVTLASSYLQLQSTPWLNETWGKKDIVFGCEEACNTQRIDIEKPYILQSVRSTTQESNNGSGNLQASASNAGTPGPAAANLNATKMSGNFSLLALGILLLELYTGQSFEHYQATMTGKDNNGKSLGSTAEIGDVTIERLLKLSEASQWMKKIQDDLSEAYFCAIRHCIRSYFDETSGKDETMFCQAVLEQVVLPLQEELQTFTGESR